MLCGENLTVCIYSVPKKQQIAVFLYGINVEGAGLIFNDSQTKSFNWEFFSLIISAHTLNVCSIMHISHCPWSLSSQKQ